MAGFFLFVLHLVIASEARQPPRYYAQTLLARTIARLAEGLPQLPHHFKFLKNSLRMRSIGQFLC